MDLHSGQSDAETYFTISLSLCESTAWADASHEIAWFQHRLSSPNQILLNKGTDNKRTSRSTLEHCGTSIRISGLEWFFEFDRIRGYITKWVSKGVQLLQSDSTAHRPAVIPGFWRPPTDNDRPTAFPYWQRFGVDAMTSQLVSMEATTASEAADNESISVKAHTFLSPPSLDWGVHVHTTYTISPAGSLTVKGKFHPTGSIPSHIPRIGFNLCVNSNLQKSHWFGLGPGEAYPDKKSAQRFDIWDSLVDIPPRYDVPQEFGNHMETRWVTLTPSPKGIGIRAAGPEPFSWQASRYSAETIEKAKHPCDLPGKEENITLLRLDARVAGVGSAACGPGPREDMLVSLKEDIEFSFVLESVEV